jgi:serine/threonine protein kinase
MGKPGNIVSLQGGQTNQSSFSLSTEYLKDLGSGQYGLVFQGNVNEEIEGEISGIVAVKTLREGSSQDAIKEFCQEVNIMSTFSHPNVVKLVRIC